MSLKPLQQYLPSALRPALRLVSTQAMSREDWLAVRKQGIGSSDAAAAVGLNPYKSQLELWMEKTGRDAELAQIDPSDDSQPVYWGTLLEPYVARAYSTRTGHRVRRINAVLRHPDPALHFMLANIDREVVACSEVQILECKTAGINGARLWRDGVPEYVVLQVQHQLAVTGKQAADVAVLIGGQELQVHRIARDDALIKRLITLEAEFWQHVLCDVPPPADGSESADQALRCLYPQDDGQTLDFREDSVMSATFADWVAVRDIVSSYEATEAKLKQALQQAMGSASKALFDTGLVTYKRSKDGTQFDEERFLKEQPEVAKHYLIPKPGSRRFRLV